MINFYIITVSDPLKHSGPKHYDHWPCMLPNLCASKTTILGGVDPEGFVLSDITGLVCGFMI